MRFAAVKAMLALAAFSSYGAQAQETTQGKR